MGKNVSQYSAEVSIKNNMKAFPYVAVLHMFTRGVVKENNPLHAVKR